MSRGVDWPLEHEEKRMGSNRSRRGGNAIEVALTMPLFLVAIFSLIDYSWYFYTEAMTIEATRQGCRLGAVTPAPDYEEAAFDYIDAELSRLGVAGGMSMATNQYSGSPSSDTVNLYIDGDLLECNAQIEFVPPVGLVPMPEYVVASAKYTLEQPPPAP
jgi:hypothetical protein